jgi:hypothetical protein
MSKIDDTLNAVSDKLDKAKGEILDAIDKLSTEAANGNVSQATLDRLNAAAQSLDDVVPDEAPADPGTEPTTDPQAPTA